eukprot:3378759-Prymnesium_polylepis.1
MRRSFETVWRALGPADAGRAPQLVAPQWQLLLPEHADACELAVQHACAVSADEVEGRAASRAG